MVAFFRHFIVVLLVLLQFAAPLVHAHVDDKGHKQGLHIHEFESIPVKNEALFASVADYAASAQSAIVELGSAINIQSPDEDNTPVYYLSHHPIFKPEQHIFDSINFSPHEQVLVKYLFLSQKLTRAPPA